MLNIEDVISKNLNLIKCKTILSYLLLSSPKSSDAFSVQLDDPERDVPLVEHDDLVLVRTIVDDVPEGEERRRARQNGRSPSRIAWKKIDVLFIFDWQTVFVDFQKSYFKRLLDRMSNCGQLKLKESPL